MEMLQQADEFSSISYLAVIFLIPCLLTKSNSMINNKSCSFCKTAPVFWQESHSKILASILAIPLPFKAIREVLGDRLLLPHAQKQLVELLQNNIAFLLDLALTFLSQVVLVDHLVGGHLREAIDCFIIYGGKVVRNAVFVLRIFSNPEVIGP